MKENFDIKALQSRISELKKETEHSVSFTKRFLECLIYRHDLKNIIHDDHEFDNIPEDIAESLKNGEIPSDERIMSIDVESQDLLIKQCIYMCGLGAIAWYGENLSEYEDVNPKPFDLIVDMVNISAGHYTATLLIASLALLSSNIPTQFMIEQLTNNFDSSDEQVEKNLELYNEICMSIIDRYEEDKEYYGKEE